MVRSAVAGAVLSNIATILQLGVVVGSTSPATLLAIAPSLALGGTVAAIYGAALAAFARGNTAQSGLVLGRPFEFRTALVLGAMVSAIMFGSTVLLNLLGETGAMLASAFGGLADAHAAAISMSSLVASGKLAPSAAVMPILVGVTANSITKVVVAFGSHSLRFSLQVGAGILLVVAGLWAGTLVTLPLANYSFGDSLVWQTSHSL
jgi:uncharacterized membrane protein (DUF4010 family)